LKHYDRIIPRYHEDEITAIWTKAGRDPFFGSYVFGHSHSSTISKLKNRGYIVPVSKPLTSHCTQTWKLADYLADICMSILGKPPEGYEIALASATEARLQKALDQRAGYNQDAYKRARQSEQEAYA